MKKPIFKIVIVVFAMVVLALFIFKANTGPTVSRIALAPETEYTFKHATKGDYGFLINKSLEGDRHSFQELLELYQYMDAAAALGFCVLVVEIALELGDAAFANLITSSTEKDKLYNLLEIGLAYTAVESVADVPVSKVFPKTYEKLNHKK